MIMRPGARSLVAADRSTGRHVAVGIIVHPLPSAPAIFKFPFAFNVPRLREVAPVPDFRRTAFRSLAHHLTRMIVFSIATIVVIVYDLTAPGSIFIKSFP